MHTHTAPFPASQYGSWLHYSNINQTLGMIADTRHYKADSYEMGYQKTENIATT